MSSSGGPTHGLKVVLDLVVTLDDSIRSSGLLSIAVHLIPSSG